MHNGVETSRWWYTGDLVNPRRIEEIYIRCAIVAQHTGQGIALGQRIRTCGGGSAVMMHH